MANYLRHVEAPEQRADPRDEVLVVELHWGESQEAAIERHRAEQACEPRPAKLTVFLQEYL